VFDMGLITTCQGYGCGWLSQLASLDVTESQEQNSAHNTVHDIIPSYTCTMLPVRRCVPVRPRPCTRRNTSSMIRCSQGNAQLQALSPGQLISKLNSESLGKNDEHLIAVKRALDQVGWGMLATMSLM